MKLVKVYAIGMLLIIAAQLVDDLILIATDGRPYEGRFLLSATGLVWLLVSLIVLPFFKLNKVSLLVPSLYAAFIAVTLVIGFAEAAAGLISKGGTMPIWHSYVDVVVELAFAYMGYRMLKGQGAVAERKAEEKTG